MIFPYSISFWSTLSRTKLKEKIHSCTMFKTRAEQYYLSGCQNFLLMILIIDPGDNNHWFRAGSQHRLSRKSAYDPLCNPPVHPLFPVDFSDPGRWIIFNKGERPVFYFLNCPSQPPPGYKIVQNDNQAFFNRWAARELSHFIKQFIKYNCYDFHKLPVLASRYNGRGIESIFFPGTLRN